MAQCGKQKTEASRDTRRLSPSKPLRCDPDSQDMPRAGRQEPRSLLEAPRSSEPLRHPGRDQGDATRALGFLPGPSPAPGEVKGKPKPQGLHLPPRRPLGTHRGTGQPPAAPYLHSVMLQQQLPLRRLRRPQHSSILDFLRPKYSVSFPNEAMAPAATGHRPRHALGHATRWLLRAPSARGGSAAGHRETDSTGQEEFSQESLVGWSAAIPRSWRAGSAACAGLHGSSCLCAGLVQCCRAELRRRGKINNNRARWKGSLGSDGTGPRAPQRAAARQVRELAAVEVAQGGCGDCQPGEGMLPGSESDEKPQEIGSGAEFPKGLFFWHRKTGTIDAEDPRLLFVWLFRVHRFSSRPVSQSRRHPSASGSTYLHSFPACY